ncbi:MAG: NB-ARC domain-containing protein [Elainella sp. Prado103]|nr:NB-ARC domain-containing protein [Elainella sp. Prado103]
MPSLKASVDGLAQIKQSRKATYWPIEDNRWLIAASQILEPEINWQLDRLSKQSIFANGVSLSTWKRFLQGKPIRAEVFQAFCQVLQLDWQLIAVQHQANHEHRLPRSATENPTDKNLSASQPPEQGWQVHSPQAQESQNSQPQESQAQNSQPQESQNSQPQGSQAQNSQAQNSQAHQPEGKEIADSPITAQIDWGEAPGVVQLYGRSTELETLTQWIVTDRCRLVMLLGMGGMGKTTLAVRLAEQLSSEFDYIIWRSLQNMLPIADWLADLIQFLSNQQETNFSESISARITLLTQLLRRHRCLLILDNLESILQAGDRLGNYRLGYELYGYLFQTIGQSAHRSCLLLTSREKPRDLSYLEGSQLPIRSFPLQGLPLRAGQELFDQHGKFVGSAQAWQHLIEHYAGNPLAIKMVAPVLQDFFDSNISQFLEFVDQNIFVFDNMRDLLERQFARLSDAEMQVMYWLAINREPTLLPRLREDWMSPPTSTELIDTLVALQRRSLIERGSDGFYLLPVVMEYVTDRLIQGVLEELNRPASFDWVMPADSSLSLFQSFALLKAQAKDYIRDAQTCLILEPIARQLLTIHGHVETIQSHLMERLEIVRASIARSSYAAGNSLNLLRFLGADLRGLDYSNLAIRQADLVGATLTDLNFAGADLSTARFTETFTATLSVAFSPDGQYLAIGNADGQVRVWSAMDGKRRWTLAGHTSWVSSVSFSPDSQRLATASFDRIIQIWDLVSGDCIKTLAGHQGWVWSVDWSPDGQQLASGSTDRTIKLWDVTTATCLQTLRGHHAWIRTVVFHPTQPLLASSGHEGQIWLWNLQTGQTDQLQGHVAWVAGIAFSPDGLTLVSGGHDGTLRLWDMATTECRQIWRIDAHVIDVDFSPDGQTIATGDQKGKVRLWDLNTRQCIKTCCGHTNGVWSIAFHPQGRTLVSGSNDSSVKVWDTKTGQSIHTFQGYSDGIKSLTFSQDGQWLISGCDDSTIKVWHLPRGECLHQLTGHASWVWSVAMHPSRPLLASGSSDQTVRLWDWQTQQPLKCWRGHVNLVLAIAFHPNGDLLASGSFDQTVRLWSLSSEQNWRKLTVQGQVYSLSFSPDGCWLAMGLESGVVLLWQIDLQHQTLTCVQMLELHQGIVFSVTFSPDGEWLASGSTDRTMRLYHLPSQTPTEPFNHSGQVYQVAFHPGGQWLASAGEDQTVRLWDRSTRQCLQTLTQHHSKIWAIAFSPDGSILASGSQDGVIHCWQPQTGKWLQTLRGQRPYENLDITGAIGLTPAQKDSLQLLGAQDRDRARQVADPEHGIERDFD